MRTLPQGDCQHPSNNEPRPATSKQGGLLQPSAGADNLFSRLAAYRVGMPRMVTEEGAGSTGVCSARMDQSAMGGLLVTTSRFPAPTSVAFLTY